MVEQQPSKAEMVHRMQTSRAQPGRFLDPENEALTLPTMQKAARAVGRRLRLALA